MGSGDFGKRSKVGNDEMKRRNEWNQSSASFFADWLAFWFFGLSRVIFNVSHVVSNPLRNETSFCIGLSSSLWRCQVTKRIVKAHAATAPQTPAQAPRAKLAGNGKTSKAKWKHCNDSVNKRNEMLKAFQMLIIKHFFPLMRCHFNIFPLPFVSPRWFSYFPFLPSPFSPPDMHHGERLKFPLVGSAPGWEEEFKREKKSWKPTSGKSPLRSKECFVGWGAQESVMEEAMSGGMEMMNWQLIKSWYARVCLQV